MLVVHHDACDALSVLPHSKRKPQMDQNPTLTSQNHRVKLFRVIRYPGKIIPSPKHMAYTAYYGQDENCRFVATFKELQMPP